MAERTDDELNELLRAAMKTLDAQVPSGYFDALASRTLGRLAASEGTMQTGTSGTEATSSGVPPTPAEEDSGLHDIRNLAETAKARISSKRISTSSIKTDDELLASASGSWKSLALPQPAAMISLPEVAEAKKADKKQEKTDAVATVATTAAVAAKSSAPASTSTLRKRVAIAGIGLAAAAGVTLFLTMRPDAEPTADRAPLVATSAPAAAPVQPTVQPIEAPKPAPVAAAADNNEAPAGGAATAETTALAPAPQVAAAPEPVPAKIATKHAVAKPTAHVATKTVAKAEIPAKTAPAPTPAPATKAKASGSDESFDSLLKEAGVQEKKDNSKPVLEKKELSAGDFKTGMAAIQSKAAACYKGTQGMAQVKLVVAPSGKVSRVTVSGSFAGKPEADCVTAAVKTATFPPWDGGPQTMGYSFLLSE